MLDSIHIGTSGLQTFASDLKVISNNISKGLTKGRISQVHHSALRRLRERLREPKAATDL